MNILCPLRFPPPLAILAAGVVCLPAVGAETVSAAADQSFLVFIGTYTGAKSEGIYVAHFNAATGRLGAPELAAKTINPSFLALHPNRRFLYAVGEGGGTGVNRRGAVSAFSIDEAGGKLTFLNEQSSGGGGPCHLSVDQTGKWLLTANYGSGSVAVLPIEADGRLGAPSATVQHQGSSVDPQRQTGPHAHFITTAPDNRVVLACDLGLDKVLLYRLDAEKGSLSPNDPPWATVKPGAGPRHIAFHPNGRLLFVINEMGGSFNLFAYDPKHGALQGLQALSTLPEGFTANNTAAEVRVHPSGKFVYASNRGHNSIAVFSVDVSKGKMALVEIQPTRGKTPRCFTLDPSGRWLLAENQDSDNIVVFRVDENTGRLTPTGDEVKAGSPVCLVFLPHQRE